ncbi:MAG: tetratricopeptide repeat protein [Thermodesulfovibrionales bacterium]|nr:tetratricopeptide repeat protein [Thermodesulfovibrionales bacterium]
MNTRRSLKDRVLNEKIKITLVLLVVLLMAMLTYHRNSIWIDEISLWKDTVKKSPSNQRAFFNLSVACRKAGDIECALSASRRALEIYPEPVAFMNLANVLQVTGRDDEAELLYEEAIKRAESESVTQEMKKVTYKFSYYELGNINFKRGDLKRAEYYYRKVIEIEPEYSPAWNNLGYVLMISGRCKEAEFFLRKALELDPGDTLAKENLELLKECR